MNEYILKHQFSSLVEGNGIFPFKYEANGERFYVGRAVHEREGFYTTYHFQIIKATFKKNEDLTPNFCFEVIDEEQNLDSNEIREETLFEHSYDVRKLAKEFNEELPKWYMEEEYLKACRKIIKKAIRNKIIEPKEINWGIYKMNDFVLKEFF